VIAFFSWLQYHFTIHLLVSSESVQIR
jgi:hypothetical protein